MDIAEKENTPPEQIKQLDCTPNKRKRLLSKFNVCSPSPSIKQSKVTENEMKMLSLAEIRWKSDVAESKIRRSTF